MKKSGAPTDQMARAVIVFVLTILTATKAHGTWFRQPSACGSYSSASAVFLGQVTSSETLSDGSTRTRFDVKEVFKGVSATELVVVSVRDSMLGIGAVHLRSGEKYLVFASRYAEHTLGISYLSIIPPSLAASELRFLHAQGEKDPPKTMLYGTLLQPMDDQHGEHLIATRIDINGPSGSFQTATDPDGYFEFRNIPVGKYQVTPELPDMLVGRSSEVTIKEGGCAAVPLIAVWNGRISGCARRSDGQPIAEANVSLIDLARKRGEGIAERTDERGCYQFEHLESGRYVVGLLDMDDPSDDYPFPPMFYPNAVSPDRATVLELAKGEKLDNVDFSVQDFDPRLLHVQVLWPDRRPAADAHVFIEYEQSYCWKQGCVLAYFNTHEDGRVTFYGYGRGRVRVYAVAKHSSGKEWISEFKELSLADLPFATTLTISGPIDYNAVGR